MFAVIYRCTIYPERESEYRHVWRQITHYLKSQRGALGSCLHKTEQGEWVAYSRWPNKETRDSAWVAQEGLTPEIQAAIAILKSCMTKPHEEICLEVEEDLLCDTKKLPL